MGSLQDYRNKLKGGNVGGNTSSGKSTSLDSYKQKFTPTAVKASNPVSPVVSPPKPVAPPENPKAIPPNGGSPARKLANGNIAYTTPSGTIWEYKPDGTRIVHLAAQFGGGGWEDKGPGTSNTLLGTAQDRQAGRAYGNIPSVTGDNRDHIIPVSLGGTSDPTNIRQVQKSDNPAAFEADLASKVKAGQMTVNQARLAIMTKKQDMFMNTPKQGIVNNLLEGTADAVHKLFPSTNDQIDKIKQDPLNLKAEETDNMVNSAKDYLSGKIGLAHFAERVIDPKAQMKVAWDVIKENVKAEGSAIKDVFADKGHDSIAHQVSTNAHLIATTANLAFTPITALFKQAERVPVLGSVAKLVSVPFSIAGEAGSDLAKTIINKLPISQEKKDQLNPGVQEIFSLAGQLLLGKAGEGAIKTVKTELPDALAGMKDKLVEKYGKTDANTIIEKAHELATHEAEQTQKFADRTAPKVYSVENGVLKETPMTKVDTNLIEPKDRVPAKVQESTTKLNVAELSKNAVNSLENSTTGIKPGGIDRASSEMQAGTSRPIQVRTLEDGTIHIEDGRHRLEAARNLGLKDIPVEDVTSKYQSQVPKEDLTVSNKGSKPINEPISKPNTGDKVSKIGRSIEAKAVEARLTKGFENVAGYESTTFKEQAKNATDLVNNNMDHVREIIRGEADLPENVRGVSLITAVEEHLKANPDPQLYHELANSHLVSGTSHAAQELSLARMREPDSATTRLADIKKAKEAKAAKQLGEENVKKVRAAVRSTKNKVLLPKEELSLNKFLDDIKC